MNIIQINLFLPYVYKHYGPLYDYEKEMNYNSSNCLNKY